MDRRDFIRVTSLSAAAVMVSRNLLFAENRITTRGNQHPKRYLHGNPRFGCSTVNIHADCLGGINTGVDEFENYAFLASGDNGVYC
ncbi:MAG: hypothetical protein GF307_10320 [candidate division Zixibacteria bacterium]|nr:hypothetical protein [candidate division Zixibacteria bacterium]